MSSETKVQLPVQDSERKCTDSVCIFFALAFAVTMFVLAAIAYTPTAPSTYFSITEPERSSDISGADYWGFLDTLKWTSIAAGGLGLLWVIIVRCFPHAAPYLALLFAIASLGVISVQVYVIYPTLYMTYPWLQSTVFGVFAFSILLLLIYACRKRDQLKFQGICLSYASQYTKQQPSNILLIFVWLILLGGITALFIWQQVAFSYKAGKNNNLFDFTNPGVLGFLNIFQYLWGLQFLKLAFIFVLSDNSVYWYWRKQGKSVPHYGWSNLIRHNVGSVIAGALIYSVLKYPLIVLEYLICHEKGCTRGCCGDNCCCFLVSLPRTDSFAYTSLHGTSYCDSSNECIRLCQDTPHSKTIQSPLRNYRIIATIFLTATSYIIGYIFLNTRVKSQNLWFHAVLWVMVNAISNIFASFAASEAEGLQVSSFAQYVKERQYEKMRFCEPQYRDELREYATKTYDYKEK